MRESLARINIDLTVCRLEKKVPFFTGDEMAALDWTECFTNISQTFNMDEKLEMLMKHYSGVEVVDFGFRSGAYEWV